MKILAFGASYSQTSINKEFATYAASKFEDANVEILDLNNYQLPLLTIELENEIGHPAVAKEFVNKLAEAELIIISLSEHNGSYTAAFKKDRKSTRLNSSHVKISYAVFCLKKKTKDA